MSWLGLEFEVIASDFDESLIQSEEIEDLVEELALQKALTISKSQPDSLVIGADTMVSLAERQIGKANDPAEAKEMISRLSGKTHQVTTGVAILVPGDDLPVIFHDQSSVSFRPIDTDEIEDYLETSHWQDKAGAYAIQEEANKFVSGYQGSYTNIMGLPLLRLAEELENLGFDMPSDLSQIIETNTGKREV